MSNTDTTTDAKKATTTDAKKATTTDATTDAKKATTDAKKATIKRVTLKTSVLDFSETLEITRTLFKNAVSKTSIVETALACASANSASYTTFQIATFIVDNLKASDCYHKKDRVKNDDFKSVCNRVRRHVAYTEKHHYKADTLYSYIKSSDTIVFTDHYQEYCKTDKLYRKRISALIQNIKTDNIVKAKSDAIKKAELETLKKEAIKANKAIKKEDTTKTDTDTKKVA